MNYSRYFCFGLPFLVILISSISHGFLSPDNINYLTMADTQHGDICHVGGRIFGLFPCGYPMGVRLFSFVSQLDLFHASKVLNLLMLVGVFFSFRKVFASSTIAFLISFNPFSIQSAIASGAEIVLLLAFALYCLILHKIKESDEVKIKHVFGIMAVVCLGCFSRYLFAPLSVLLFLCSFLLIKDKAWRTLPGFVIPAILFVAYRYYLRDFDMERIPAPESQVLIIFQFIKSSIKAVAFSLPILIFALIGLKKVSFRPDLKNPWSWFFAALGVSYLIMILTVRSLYQFDFFGIRFVGFGYGLILAAILLAVRTKIEDLPAPAMMFGALFMYVAVTEAAVFRYPMIDQGIKQAVFDTLRLKKQDNTPKDYALLVTDRPMIHPLIAVKGIFDTYQHGHLVFLPDLPYQKKYEIPAIKDKLSDKPCFVYFDLKQDINDYVNQTYRTGLKEHELIFSDTVRTFLLNKYGDNDNRCF